MSERRGVFWRPLAFCFVSTVRGNRSGGGFFVSAAARTRQRKKAERAESGGSMSRQRRSKGRGRGKWQTAASLLLVVAGREAQNLIQGRRPMKIWRLLWLRCVVGLGTLQKMAINNVVGKNEHDWINVLLLCVVGPVWPAAPMPWAVAAVAMGGCHVGMAQMPG